MEIPIELEAIFKQFPDAKAKFLKMPESHRNEYIEYIVEAKRDETRVRRADRVIMMLTDNNQEDAYKSKANTSL